MLDSKFDLFYKTLPRKACLLVAALSGLAFAFTHDGVTMAQKDFPSPTADYLASQTGDRFIELPHSDKNIVLEVVRYCSSIGMGVNQEDESNLSCYFSEHVDAPYPVELGDDHDSIRLRQSTLLDFCLERDGNVSKVAPDDDHKELGDLVFACRLPANLEGQN